MDNYQITSAVEIDGLLKSLIDSKSLITLSGPGGTSYITTLSTVDPDRKVLSFNAEEGDARLQALLETDEVSAVGYLNNIKVQFELEGLVQVHGEGFTAVNAQYPDVLYRFQRRESYRVKPINSQCPGMRIRHPDLPDLDIKLRALDISLGGVALFLPHDVAMMSAGVELTNCAFELDSATSLNVGVVIHHASVINPDTHGARLGCELVHISDDDKSALQDYIQQTQKRRRALALD